MSFNTNYADMDNNELVQAFVSYLNETDEDRMAKVKDGHARQREMYGRVNTAHKTRDM